MYSLNQTVPNSWMNVAVLFVLIFLTATFAQPVQLSARAKMPSNASQQPVSLRPNKPSVGSGSQTQTSRQQGTNEVARDFSGAWKLKANRKHPDQRLAAIEKAIAALGRFQKGLAREMLTKKTAPPNKLNILDLGDQVKLKQTKFEVTIPYNGKGVVAKTELGRVTLQAFKRDGKLTVVSKTSSATLTKVYEVSADGKSLAEQVQVQSNKFPQPIKFTNRYVK